RVSELVDRFPADGTLVCLYAVALAKDERWADARRQLDHARSLGAEPRDVLPVELVSTIEEKSAPSWLELLAWGLGGAAVFYAVVMLLMALVGVVLASRTRGSRALELLGTQPDSLVASGQVVRTRHESTLTTLYGLALLGGLVLFYLAIPFVIT